ncbi:hypothetical protein Tco_0561994 [Tanacetum coccineum]
MHTLERIEHVHYDSYAAEIRYPPIRELWMIKDLWEHGMKLKTKVRQKPLLFVNICFILWTTTNWRQSLNNCSSNPNSLLLKRHLPGEENNLFEAKTQILKKVYVQDKRLPVQILLKTDL